MKRKKIRNIKLTLEYDGTDFYGFQRQPGGVPTIQQALESALEKLFREKTPIASASSRTDAGVHAEDQIVHFKTVHELSCSRLARAINHFLPPAISVKKAEEVSENFHARFQPISKIYEYYIWNHSSRPAIGRNFVHHEPAPLKIEAMKKAAKYFLGKHDFRAFTSEDRIVKGRGASKAKISFARTIQKLTIQKKSSKIVFTFQADGFLYHMVRNIAGTLVAVGKGKLAAESIPRILKSRDRKQAAATLPARGLCLKRVIYP